MISDLHPKYGLRSYLDELHNEASLWTLFTKEGEYLPKTTDRYERVPYAAGGPINILNPAVSRYMVRHGFHPEYPDGKKFALFLSHDVDDIAGSSRQTLRSLLPYPLHRDPFGFLRFLSLHERKEKLYMNFQQIIDLERRYDASSTFFFLSTPEDVFGTKYRLEGIADELHAILDSDCEIGLHTSFSTYDDLQKIKVEKAALETVCGREVVGARNHLYRFKIPKTWSLLSQAGFTYDSSLGYHDMIGFRNGMCHPFKPYNLCDGTTIDIIEIPSCVVDITLFSYMKCDAAEAWGYIKSLMDMVEELGGVLTVLWHNWTFSYPVSYAGLFGKEWTTLYENILRYGYEKHAWITNGQKIAEFVKKNY